MSGQVINILLIVGVLGGGILLLINRCEWLKWCDDSLPDLSDISQIIQDSIAGIVSPENQKKLAEAIGAGALTPAQFNSLPTIGNTKDSNYRSVSINTNPNAQKNAAKAIQQQQNFSTNPKVKAGVADYLRATGYKPPAKSGLAISLHGRKMSYN